jgi:hypothetical protein
LFYKKKQWRPPSKKKKIGKKHNEPEEQEGMPQRQHVSTALLKSVAERGTQSAILIRCGGSSETPRRSVIVEISYKKKQWRPPPLRNGIDASCSSLMP